MLQATGLKIVLQGIVSFNEVRDGANINICYVAKTPQFAIFGTRVIYNMCVLQYLKIRNSILLCLGKQMDFRKCSTSCKAGLKGQ